MTKYQAGDIALVTFPFVEGGPGKQRPALVILDAGDADVLLARVTTQPQHTRFDLLIMEWRNAGLRAPCTVRLHKLATVKKSLITRRLGQLSDSDWDRVAEVLPNLIASWQRK